MGYCAAKDEKYFGFKGHLLMSSHGVPLSFTMAAANIDERDVLPELVEGLKGLLIADKGLIRPELKGFLMGLGLSLETPLRDNMKETRPSWLVKKIKSVRRKVETVIGQFVERFNIQKIRAKDLWHLTAKVGRKILAHIMAFFVNLNQNPDKPLQLQAIIKP